MIDDLEYKVYQRWFDWLMETNRPQVDLIGMVVSLPRASDPLSSIQK